MTAVIIVDACPLRVDVMDKESETWYECCATPYARVTFILRLRRKPLYYVINLILPYCLFSILTAITFLLQPGCSERLGLGRYTACPLTAVHYFVLISCAAEARRYW